MNWLFYLDDIEIEEPVGFSDLELSIKRDDNLHGIVFQASTSPLDFYGAAYDYLLEQKELYGVKANVTFSAWQTCDNYDYEKVLTGRLNFGKYKRKCGSVCTISIPWEEDSCEIVLKSRYDQKVDMDKAVGIDGITPLTDYAALGAETELTAHNLKTGTEGYVEDAGNQIDVSIFEEAFAKSWVRPTYGRAVDESLQTSQLTPTVFAASNNGLNDSVLSPVLLLEELPDCTDGTIDYSVRLKGSFDILFEYSDGDPNPVTSVFRFKAGVGRGEFDANQAVGNPGPGLTILHSDNISTGANINHWVGTFDLTYSGNTVLPNGEGFYTFLTWEPTGPFSGVVMIGNITFDKETFVNIQSVRSCPPTNAELYMVHESLSRVTEAVTNGCVRVKSSYFGRTDSEPFSFPADGCGGLRSVTSGLKIRRAEEDKFFTSVKDLVEGLNAIDNIGVAVEPDPSISGRFLMLIEDLDFFYRDQELLRHDFIPTSDEEIEEARHYTKIDVGYKEWEVESVNGLDEFNSTRQYNTSLDTVNTSLDITSNLVAGSYPIEITRQQSFATTGAADTKYDNKVFIMEMIRSDYPYGNIGVKQGGITSPENIFSPATVYNFGISPLRNLMRWYRTIAAGFASISDNANKLFFSSGTGNLIAKGILTDIVCRMESMVIQENQDLYITHFADPADYTPLWKNETITYEYPMSIADYKTIKENPYGYISSQCGGGELLKYWIKEIKYRLAKGKATFVLRRKYGN